jgi:hypothetical protein
MDENQTAQPSEAPPSGAEGQNIVTPQPPAEAQNTVPEEWQPDKNAKFVPYDRFQEVVQARNDFREKMKTFEGKEELLKTYEQFDQVLNTNPQLFQAIMGLFNQQPQEQAPEQQLDTNQKLVLDNYMGRFNNFCTESKIPEEMKAYVYQVAESFLLKINPDPLRNYDMRSLDMALNHTKKLLESIGNSKLANYVQTKPRENNVPASASRGGGAPVPAPQPLSSQQDRASAAAQFLRAGV